MTTVGMTADKETKALDFEIRAVGEDGTFEGLASTYGEPPDAYGDIIEKGAFSKTIEDHSGEIVVLWQHDQTEPIGRGVLEDSEDGLVIRGKLELDLDTARKAYIALRTKLVKGLSIGFRTLRKKTEKGVRKLLEIKLYEVSLVTFPANERALVTGVKSALSDRMDEMKVSASVWGTWSACDSIIMRTMFDREMTTEDKIKLIDDTLNEFKGMFLGALPDYFEMFNLSSDGLSEEDRSAIEKSIEFRKSFLKVADTAPSKGAAVTPTEAQTVAPEGRLPPDQLKRFRDAVIAAARN